MSSLVEEAFEELYPGKKANFNFFLEYSGKFKAYNANVRRYGNDMTFSLSKKWRKISRDIQIGLVQELMLKIMKDKKKTMNMELYNLFLKNIHVAIPKTKSDPLLEESFNRVNDAYFNGMMDIPNLEWGNDSTSKLGSYHYGSDLITISTIFQESKKELLDYIIYHELLHKKFKFESKNGRSLHHSPEFKRMEAKFENRDFVEKEVSKLARKHRFGGFF